MKSHVEGISQNGFECVIIDPKAGGYAQDIRRAEVCQALATYLRSPKIFLILASPDPRVQMVLHATWSWLQRR